MENINDAESLKTFVQNAGDKAVCVKVGAGWCAPCRILAKVIEGVETEYAEKVVFGDIEADEVDEDFLNELNVTNIPVLLFYKNGLQVDRTVGMIGKDALVNKIEENYAK